MYQPLNVFIYRLAGDSKSLCRKLAYILRVVFDLIKDELPDLFTAFACILLLYDFFIEEARVTV